MKVSSRTARMPGNASRRVTRWKVCHRLAPDMAAASSSDASMALSAGSISRNTTGDHRIASSMIMPPEREQLDRDAVRSEQQPQPLVDHPLVGPEEKNRADALNDHRRGERQIGGDHHQLAEIRIGARHQPSRAHPDRGWRGRSCRPHRAARPAIAASRSSRRPRHNDRGRTRIRRRSRPSRSCP